MTKNLWIKIGIIVMITGVMYFSGFSFADDSGVTGAIDEKIGTIGFLLNLIISILSWIWILFAKIAGEFLTNKWVYGEIIGLDKLLWKYWVIVKNIANFGLGFYFIYVIFSAVIGKDDIMKKVKSILLWILVAGVGIQASWFFVAAMIDVSTITMVAAGSLPSQIISQNEKMEEYIHNSLSNFVDSNFKVTTGEEYTLFPPNRSNGVFLERISVPISGSGSKENFIDMLMPNADDVSGPLYYIGFQILKNGENLSKLDFSGPNEIKKTILNLIILGGTTIIYSIEMLVFCVLALMRIVYLWMFIVLSPLAVLLRCIGKSDKNLGDKLGGFVKSITKHVNFKSFFLNIFKPTIIVLGMGIALMFSILMSGEINKNGNNYIDKDLGGIHISSQKGGDGNYDTSITSDFWGYSLKNVAKSLLEMIISIITVILIYFVIKISVEIGKSDDFVSTNIKSLQDNIQETMTSIPIVPVPGYDKNGAVDPNAGLSRNSLKEFPKRKLDDMTTKANYQSKQTEEIMRSWGLLDDNRLTPTDKTRIENAGKDYKGIKILEEKRKYINDNIKNETGKGMKLDPNASDQFWIQEFTGWLEGMRNQNVSLTSYNDVWNNMISRWNDDSNKDKTLEMMFKGNKSGETQSVEAYADFFDLNLNSNTWEQLKNADISKK